MTEREIERWTREVAEDPGAPSFVRLARAYRGQGRQEAARSVVLRGLEQNPEHLGGHGLLALIHVEEGERQKAGDEWQTMLRLDPGNFDASRGLGFLALERDDLGSARRHLSQAARSRPDDPSVTQALNVLERRESKGVETAETAETARRSHVPHDSQDYHDSHDPHVTPVSEPARGGAVGARDPAGVFDGLWDERPFLGAVVLDSQGLIVAGSLDLEGYGDERLGALINTAVLEARRTTEMVGLGDWDGLMLDCDEATLHVAELPGDTVVLMAARSGAPAGWALRTAERVKSLALEFLEERV